MSADKIMFVFPGQGSQYRGMGSDLHADFPVARELYGEASEVLGYDLEQLSFHDPQEQIGLTRYTQPALMTHEIACLRVFNELTGGAAQPIIAGGHSLGEYTALVAAGSLSFADGLRLVSKRGELMHEYGQGGMVALPLDLDTARSIADRFYCEVGGCNLPEQTVIGGPHDDLDALTEYVAEHYPRKRVARLATEGAFHTYAMVNAALAFRPVLESTAFSAPRYPVLSNYTSKTHDDDPDSIRTRLFFQLFHAVKWNACLLTAMEQGIDMVIEFGGGLGSGEEIADKRPNLEGIIKKNLKRENYEASYIGAISADRLRDAAEEFAG
ncbi:MAG: ACP S-malonyltransferase [Gammaproteobacteria bacterium]|nr:ACP S-malonyltransferase [Gammaproteobacteria bacterium]